MKQISNNIKWLMSLFCVFTLSLLKVPTAFADVPIPQDDANKLQCRSYFGSLCTENTLWDRLSLSIPYFLVGTLIIELPIFLIYGFRTKKKLGFAILTNIISVPLYHVVNASLTGTNVFAAESLIIIFEIVFLVFFLKKEMRVSRIISATIVANIVSYILGGFIINFVSFLFY